MVRVMDRKVRTKKNGEFEKLTFHDLATKSARSADFIFRETRI